MITFSFVFFKVSLRQGGSWPDYIKTGKNAFPFWRSASNAFNNDMWLLLSAGETILYRSGEESLPDEMRRLKRGEGYH